MMTLRTCLFSAVLYSASAGAQPVPSPVQEAGLLITLSEETPTTYVLSNGTLSPSASRNFTFRVGDGPDMSSGYTGGGIRASLADNPEATAELNRFRSKRVQSIVGASILGAGVVTSVAMGINEPTGERVFDPRTGRTVNKTTINTTALIPVGIGVLGLIYGGVQYSTSHPHLFNAVAIYNDGISPPGSDLSLAIRPSVGLETVGATLAVRW